MTTPVRHATALLELHEAPEVLANVWDVASARAVAALPGVHALATASHAIAHAHGYEDGENIPLDLHLEAVRRIVEAVDLPISMDFESGYGAAGETARRVIAAGAVGGNLEDAMRPIGEATRAVEEVIAAASSAGVPFVLNARTDTFLLAGGDADRAALVAEAVRRGRAFLEAGAACVFVPAVRDASVIGELVDGLGRGRVSVLLGPGGPSIAELERLGVARASIGPWGMRVALTALQDVASALLEGGSFPTGVRSDGLS
jgi:2-methylisocitrate lyase-like PEP mutase family enzyme